MHAYQLNYKNPILNNLLPIKRGKKNERKNRIKESNLLLGEEVQVVILVS